jgi:glucan phosphorylase
MRQILWSTWNPGASSDDFEHAMALPARGPKVAYFCMEYGLHETLPLYAGGLGVLAGDHAKAASDLALPMTCVGLLYRHGYFVQRIDASGWQQEDYAAMDLAALPMRRLDVQVTAPLGEIEVALAAWEMHVGRTRLLLLDADVEDNPAHGRGLTAALYAGDPEHRLAQEIILGIGGVRLLRALAVEADVYHLNEGHCAFACLELAVGKSLAWAKERTVFTTHTPVPAGHDQFPRAMVARRLGKYAERELGLSQQALLALGGTGDFNMTTLALRQSRRANAVSKLNAEVAGKMLGRKLEHVTNGVHLASWAAPEARALRCWGRWEDAERMSDDEIWTYRSLLRARLAARVPGLRSDALTIGFARRFATYKRATLLLSQPDRLRALLSQPARPLQLVFAGRAHPKDVEGKRMIQEVCCANLPGLHFLPGYDIAIAKVLVSGVDVWLNTPRRPHEASGTSGQKVAPHGGLNLSILDGWWPEGYTGDNGWAIDGPVMASDDAQDEADANALFAILENDVVPMFYQGRAEWCARVRRSMTTLPQQFSAERMVRDYIEKMYAR